MKYKINDILIVEYIKNNNLTKTKFCLLCKISLETLNKALKNDLSLNITALFKMARVMKIEMYKLICEDKENN